METTGIKKFLKISCLGCFGVVFFTMFTLLLIGWVSSSKATFTEAGAEYEPERILAGSVLTPEELANSADLSAGATRFVNRVSLTADGIEKVRIRPCYAGQGLIVKN